MSLPIYLISQKTLENWDWTTPWKTGIGGSETAHVECALRLAKRGYQVISQCPLPPGKHNKKYGGVLWQNIAKFEFPKEPAIIINNRHPKLFDCKKPKGQSWWFVSQDCDYDNQWTEQSQKNLDRYLSLCKTHHDFIFAKYPLLRNKKLFVSSNGIRTDYLDAIKDIPKREPYRMFWASSPDRGLVLLLQNWFRIIERFPEATLRIAYGFDNMDTIIKWQGPNSPLIPLRNELQTLGNQKGITWLGRLPQDKVFKEWMQASVFPYPSDWPETSQISIMEAMACGAIPVTTNFWAQGEHALAAPLAYVVDGLPQKSELIRSNWLGLLFEALSKDADGEFDFQPIGIPICYDGTSNIVKSSRSKLMDWARNRYNWERIIDQWEVWINAAQPKKGKKK